MAIFDDLKSSFLAIFHEIFMNFSRPPKAKMTIFTKMDQLPTRKKVIFDHF